MRFRIFVVLFFICSVFCVNLTFAAVATPTPDPGSCFLPGTKIKTDNGDNFVEKVKVGNIVVSFDNGDIVESKVSQIFERERDFYFALKAGEYEVKASAEHPFLMWDKTYKQIQYLIPGDKVVVIDGNKLSTRVIVFNTRVNEKVKVYNMMVDNTHTFFANGFAVHNKSIVPTIVPCVEDTPYNACGWTYWRCSTATCHECQGCGRRCGQALDCGGNCSNADNGAPSVPTIISPNGTQVNPSQISNTTTTLSWNASSGLVDRYDVTLINLSTGVTVWFNNQTTLTSITTPALTMGAIYQWYVRAVNTTCGTDNSAYSTSGYFQTNQLPTVTGVSIYNSDNVLVPFDVGNRNQICKSSFRTSTTPTDVKFVINLQDLDGGTDIQTAQMRWNGTVTNLVLGDQSTVNVGSSALIDYTGVNNGNVYPIEVRITDTYSDTGWIDSGYSWKVWDCDVPVTSGTFDGSGGQACNSTGFSTPLSINSINYKNMSGGADATTNLIWTDSYLPLVNGGTVLTPDGDLQAAGRFTRLLDLGVGTTICPSSAQFDVSTDISPYSVSPAVQVDLSYIRDQEGWFEGRGVDIRAKTGISSGVPVTANSALSTDNLTIGVSNNGMVASPTYRNTNGNNDGIYGIPNNWNFTNITTDPYKTSYQTIYNNYFNKNGVGVTGVTVLNNGDTGVQFINGDLTINSNIVVAPNDYLMVVVSGSITIDPTVTRVDGIYVANGAISATGTSDSQLIINGVLYSLNNIRLARSFTVKSDNNTTPAVVVNFRPNLIFALPGKLNKIFTNWNEQ